MSLKLQMGFLRLQAWAHVVLGRPEAARACFEAMLGLQSDHRLALASRAHLDAQAGRTLHAIADLRRLTELEPQRAAHWFNLGYLLQGAEMLEEAVPCFEQATQLNPKLDQAWYGLGLSLLQLQRIDEAVAALKRNTELQPMSPYGWTQLARAHAKAAQPSKARRVVEHLRGFEPKVAEALTRELKLDRQETQENPA